MSGPLSYLGTPDATTTIKGKVELATTAETVAGTRTDLACTPAGVAAVAIAGAPAASTSQPGIIQIATNGQAADQSATELAIVPSNLPSIMAAPGAIGGSTPAAGTFTTLTTTDLVLTNPLDVAEGGTGAASLTDHGVMLGSGTGAVSVTAVGTTGQVFIGQTGADPVWATNVDLPGTLDVTGAAVFDSTVTIVNDLIVDTSVLFVDVSQDNVGIGTATPAAADKLHVTQSVAATPMIAEFENTNANAASHSQVLIQTSGATGGDPKLVLDVASVAQFSIGMDNSNSDILCISTGTAPGTTDNVQITGAGAVSVLRGNLDVTRSATGNVIATVSNTSTGAGTDNAVAQITTGGAAGGDAQLNFTVTGATSHYIGIDNSASDSLIIGLGTAVGTTAAQVIDVAGQITNPLQPSFLAYLASSATNKTGNGTAYTLGTDALTEVYDRNADFNTNGTFTAPVTGIYDLRAQVTITGATIATTFVISIVTTARTYTKTFIKAAGSQDESVDISCLADMSATNTATVTITVSGEAADTDDIKGGAALETFFCGKLVA